MKNEITIILLKIGGASQIVMALCSLLLPKVMKWREGLKQAPKLLRQMFWNYAGYILCTNIWLGLMSIFCSRELLEKSLLAKFVIVYAALYWLVRALLSFFYFDAGAAPKGWIYTVGEWCLNINFIFLAALYCWIAFLNG